MIQLLILADDFTGGLDTGVQFAQKGIRTRVVTNPDADYEQSAQGCQVLVVVAETRHLPADRAYDAVRRVVEKAVRLGIPHIYKKTDSALRGNIGAELTAALDGSGADALYFLPAMPGLNRVTRRGVHYIDGVPVAESVFGRDPFEPVSQSAVAELIALQSDVAVSPARPDDIPRAAGIVVVDAETDEDLRRAGRALKDRGGLRLLAGCAGFAAALPALLELEGQGEPPAQSLLAGGLFVLCGSVNPITQKQLAVGESNGFARCHIEPEEKLIPGYLDTPEGERSLDRWRQASRENRWMILDANDRSDDNAESAAFAEARGMTIQDVRERISGALGRLLPELLPGIQDRTLLITGGDTLLQCMNQMRVWDMEPLRQVFPGVVLSRFQAEGAARYVITKSGGFGGPTLLCDLKKMIEEQVPTNGATA